MSYFCNVKRIRTLISALTALVLFLISNEMCAAAGDSVGENNFASKMEISLLTCAPGQEVYSLYGHTAIKVDFHAGDSASYLYGGDAMIVNYGMFSFRKPFFILRFVFGLTDYEMGMTTAEDFYAEYRTSGRKVIQQTLNLTTEEKAAIWRALVRNYQPENREYRYNYFYDNCTTRARDMLVNYINGRVVYADSQKVYPSYRELIHRMNGDCPWARFGNDLLLGVKADKKTDLAEQQFLPFNLMHDFANAKIVDKDGKTRPLVKSTEVIVDATPIGTESSFPLSPLVCAWILFAVVVLSTVIEFVVKGNFWLFDTLLILLTGCAGIILFLMLFSQHPTTSTNLQLLLLNPLPLVFAWRVVKNMRGGRVDWFWTFYVALIALFFVGGIFQTYAEGMYILALSLLVRCVRRCPLFQIRIK